MTKQTSQVEETTLEGQEETTQTESQLFTQEQVNKLIGKTRMEERKKYEGFDEYKAAHEELQKLKQAEMTELEREKERSKTLEAELNARKHQDEITAWKAEVAKEKGVPIECVYGSTKEEMESNAEALKPHLADTSKPFVGSDGFAPTSVGGKKTTRELFAEAITPFFKD